MSTSEQSYSGSGSESNDAHTSDESSDSDSSESSEISNLDPRLRPSDAIHFMPNELLLEIFKVGAMTPTRSRQIPFPSLVSSVCKHWRDVAVHSPAIWADIQISDVTNQSQPFNYLPYFERSIPCLMQIYVSLSSAIATAPFFQSVSHAIKLHISRLQKLSIKSDFVVDIQSFVAPLCDILAPRLEVVDIFALESESAVSHQHFCLLSKAVALRSLSIRGICSQCSPPLVGLTSLDIYRFQPSPSEFRDLIRSSPALHTFVLRKFGRCTDLNMDSAGLPLIEAPSLRSLAVSFSYDHSVGQCTCALPLLLTTRLEYLEIIPVFDMNLSEHFPANTQKGQFSTLKTLRLVGELDLSTNTAFVLALPMITNLELVNVHDVRSLLIPRSNGIRGLLVPWRHLRSVTVDTVDSEVVSRLLEVVPARAAAGCPSLTIRVPQRHCAAALAVAESVGGQVRVESFDQCFGLVGCDTDDYDDSDDGIDAESYSDFTDSDDAFELSYYDRYDDDSGGEDFEEEYSE